MLLRHNDCNMTVLGLYAMGFLPTMKLQLSQLPMIVGSGRVIIRRALFSWPQQRALFLIQVLEARH
jgi:hypothetical protein